MAMMDIITIRLYAHRETRARDERGEHEIEAHGWDYSAGDEIEIDGETHALTWVYPDIHTGDVSGDYVEARAMAKQEDTNTCDHDGEACRYAHDTTEPCSVCRADVTITPNNRVDGDGPWCATCSAVICEACWAAAGLKHCGTLAEPKTAPATVHAKNDPRSA